MIKNTKPNLFDKAVMIINNRPVWAGTYDRQEFNLTNEVPPNPVYHALCPDHGFFKGAVTSVIVDRRHVFGVKCKCGYFKPLKFRGRTWLQSTNSDKKRIIVVSKQREVKE